VLGGYREGFEPARPKDKKHGMREGVYGEVGPVLRGRSGLEPREGQAADRVLCGERPMIRGVAV